MIQIEQIDVKNIEPISLQFKVNINSTLVERHIGEIEEYDLSDKTWILIPNQLEGGSCILIEETSNVNISDDLVKPKIMQLEKSLTEQEKKLFISILKEKQTIFAWTYEDMLGIATDLVVHNLGLKNDAKLIKQKLRKMNPMVKEELQKLLDAKFIQSIDYSK